MRTARLALLLCVCFPALVLAQDATPSRVIEFRFTPTDRAQIGIWIEKPDGTFMATVGLTQAVALHGIGNRPGASQMNSGFHWPYGRREDVLPIWATRRAAAPGAAQFKRVIFQDRDSEGDASRTTEDSTPEAYFCLSFMAAAAQKDALDAVTCASGFNSDKGRYILPADVAAGYAEPVETTGVGMMRPLDLVSLYPARRDILRCMGTGTSCIDTPDTANYANDVRQVMPDIDTVTMATLPGNDVEQSILFTVPDDWPDGDYVAWAEVNTEGDYNSTFNAQTYPTPDLPSGAWDYWAGAFGYPYRGQPSVVFRVPFTTTSVGPFTTVEPEGYSDVDGFGSDLGVVHPLDSMITDDPGGTQGSGADRFRLVAPNDYRMKLGVRGVRVGTGGDGGAGGMGGAAGNPGTDPCLTVSSPGVPGGVTAMPVADPKHSQEWGQLHFTVPASAQAINSYEVRFSTTEITVADPQTFTMALPAMAADLNTQKLSIPTNGAAGTSVDVEFGGLLPLTQYWVAIRAVNICNVAGPYIVATPTPMTTTAINFTKLPAGCFIATAAYGSSLEPEVQTLRTVRDVLRPRSVVFATATDLYYRAGPVAAQVLGRSDVARAVVRTLLGPVADTARAVLPLAAARFAP